jgi:hypothetical protein
MCFFNIFHANAYLKHVNIGLYIHAKGVEGVVRGLEGIHLADRRILTELE